MKSPILAFLVPTFVTAVVLPACGSKSGQSGDDYLAATPEQSALELSVTDDAASEGLATDSDAIDAASETTQALGETSSALSADVSPALADARDAVKDLNQALRNFMQPVVALVRDTEPTATDGNTKTWGPVTRGATEFRFIMRRGVIRTRFGWVLQARAAGSSGEFATVAAGGIAVGYAARRGIGTVGIDLDALGAVDPTVVARGDILAGFAHGPNGSTLGYRLHQFTPNPAQKAAVDAVLQRVHLKEGFNRVRLAYYGNVPGTPTDAQELVLARVRHERGVGGRADALITGGDIANGKVWVSSECWDSTLKLAYHVTRECPGDGIGGDKCTVVSTTGDSAACAVDLAAPELPPADATADMPDAQSPEGDVTPPTAMPDGAPPSAG